jgi:hypothetical protein
MKIGRYFLFSSILALTLVALAPTASQADEPLQAQSSPTLGGCPVLPADNIWNTPIDTLPVDDSSMDYVDTIGFTLHPHADFGSGTWQGAPIGIPYVIVPLEQPPVPIHIVSSYPEESDPGPYPIPSDAPIEGAPNTSGDRHVLVVRRDECKLYELYRAFPNGNGSWRADSGAIFDLKSNALRTASWTSADAAGLPILPGLVRYEEVVAGEINHALRFTAPQTRRAYVWPARHFASDSIDLDHPPMGQYFRLKTTFVIDNSFSPQGRVILQALKKYGMILADNGSSWYISGAPHASWDNDALADDFNRVSGSDFEAVNVSLLMVNPNSGQVKSFNLSAAPTSQAINAGASATYLLTLSVSGNFSSTVTLSASSPPSYLQLNLSPLSLTPPGQATLILTDTHLSEPLPGLWHTLLITATGGGFTRTTSISLLVGATRTYLPVILK